MSTPRDRADRLKQRIRDDEDRVTDPGERVTARVFAIRRQEYHWTRPDLGKSWSASGRRHQCSYRCESFTVWAYEIRIDGRLVASDNGRDWRRINRIARRKATLFLHLMGDVTILRHGTLSVGGGELV